MEKIIDYALPFCIFVVSGSLHEAAHAWSAWRCGDSTARDRGRMTLNPLVHMDLFGTVIMPILIIYSGLPCFGWMKPVPVYPPALRKPVRDDLFVSLAGPFSNLLLAFTATLVLLLLEPTGILTVQVDQVIYLVILINLLLAFFNLLPIPPLDGSSIVDFIRRDPNGTYHSQAGIGMIVICVCIYLGLFRYLFYAVEDAAFFLLSNPAVTMVLLATLTAAIVVFTVRNRPDGVVARPRKPRRAEVDISRKLKRAWQIANALSRGEDVPAADRRWFEKLQKDQGDGEPLCAPMSFDVGNDFCQECRNLNRCILRKATEE